MVGNRPSTTPQVDEDSVLLSHPIYELLDDISWENDSNNSADTEDDELQKEIDMLSSAERELSQEISDSVGLFSKKSERERTAFEPYPQRLNSPISPMNEIYVKFKKRDDNFVFREQMATTNQEKVRLESGEKTGDNISNIHEADIAMVMKDARESPGQSQPYDEVCNDILGSCTREAPEEILLFVEDDVSRSDDNPVINVFEGVGNYTNAHFRENERAPEPVNFLPHREDTDISTFVQHNWEENESTVLSQWSLRSGQLPDLEKGETNLFEEEAFWGEAFWKTPVSMSVSQNNTDLVQQEQPKKGGASEEVRKFPHLSQSKQEIIDTLSLPALDHERNKNRDHNTKVDSHSVDSRLEESNRELVDTSAKSEVRGNFTQSSGLIDPRSFPWKSSQIFPYMNENRPITLTQTNVNNHTSILRAAVSNGGDGMVIVVKEMSNQRGDMCNWRRIVLVIHVILTIVGGAVFLFFLRSKDSKNQL